MRPADSPLHRGVVVHSRAAAAVMLVALVAPVAAAPVAAAGGKDPVIRLPANPGGETNSDAISASLRGFLGSV
jgi:phosphate-selective porin